MPKFLTALLFLLLIAEGLSAGELPNADSASETQMLAPGQYSEIVDALNSISQLHGIGSPLSVPSMVTIAPETPDAAAPASPTLAESFDELVKRQATAPKSDPLEGDLAALKKDLKENNDPQDWERRRRLEDFFLKYEKRIPEVAGRDLDVAEQALRSFEALRPAHRLTPALRQAVAGIAARTTTPTSNSRSNPEARETH